MSCTNLCDAAVAAQSREDANTQFFEQWRILPHVAGNVVFTDQVNVEGRCFLRLSGADQMAEGSFTTKPAPEVLATDKTGGMYRHHWNLVFFCSLFTDQVNI